MNKISDQFKISNFSKISTQYVTNTRHKTPGFIYSCAVSDRYNIESKLGDGSFGTVMKAKPKAITLTDTKCCHFPNTYVAIKVLKHKYTLNEVQNMKEYQLLAHISSHPNIVKALEFIFDPKKSFFYIVMEKCDMSLIHLLKVRQMKKFSNENLKLILYQILLGLNHIHKNGYFHRDIKPENVLITNVHVPPEYLFENNGITMYLSESGSSDSDHKSVYENSYTTDFNKYANSRKDSSSYIIKLTDFGLARDIIDKSDYTSYVSTRWYRAPELLLRQGTYGPSVDLWAFGCMAYELCNFEPLFPGKNEADQVTLLVKGLGTPSEKNVGGRWSDFKSFERGFPICSHKVRFFSCQWLLEQRK